MCSSSSYRLEEQQVKLTGIWWIVTTTMQTELRLPVLQGRSSTLGYQADSAKHFYLKTLRYFGNRIRIKGSSPPAGSSFSLILGAALADPALSRPALFPSAAATLFARGCSCGAKVPAGRLLCSVPPSPLTRALETCFGFVVLRRHTSGTSARPPWWHPR